MLATVRRAPENRRLRAETAPTKLPSLSFRRGKEQLRSAMVGLERSYDTRSKLSAMPSI